MGKGSHQLQQLLKTLRHHCQQHLSCAFDKFQPIFTSKLAELAKNAPTNRLQTLYLDTQRLLRLQVAEIEQQTIANALKPLLLSDRSGDINHRTAEIMALGQSADDQDAAKSTGTKVLGLTVLGLTELGLTELGLTELGLTELGLTELGLKGAQGPIPAAALS